MSERPLIAMRATPLLFPAAGVAHYIRSLVAELTSLGERVALFSPFRWGMDAQRTDGAQVAAATRFRSAVLGVVPRPRQVLRNLETAWLATNARIRGVSLYHEPASLALPFRGPTVITIHDLSWIRYPESHPTDRRRTLEREFPKLLNRASHLLTDSEFVRSEVMSLFGVSAAQITTAPLAARAHFQPRERAMSAALLDRLQLNYRSYFLSVGTLEPRKNIARTLRAYTGLPAQVRQDNPLVLVGAVGWNNGAIDTEIASLANRGEVRVLGYLTDDDLTLLYGAARALVYASLYEGFGLPPLEAMASATPVIASNVSSMPEVVGDAGILVDPLDEDAIRAGFLRLAQDDELAVRLAALGVARATRFSWAACARQTRDVYRQVLARA